MVERAFLSGNWLFTNLAMAFISEPNSSIINFPDCCSFSFRPVFHCRLTKRFGIFFISLLRLSSSAFLVSLMPIRLIFLPIFSGFGNLLLGLNSLWLIDSITASTGTIDNPSRLTRLPFYFFSTYSTVLRFSIRPFPSTRSATIFLAMGRWMEQVQTGGTDMRQQSSPLQSRPRISLAKTFSGTKGLCSPMGNKMSPTGFALKAVCQS